MVSAIFLVCSGCPWLRLSSHLGNSAFPRASPLPVNVKQGLPCLISLVLHVSPCLSPPPHLPLHSLTAATLLLSGCFEWGVLGARRALDGSCLHRGSLEAALRTAYDILSHILPASWGSVHPPSTSGTQCLQKHPVGQRGRQGLWCPRSVIPVPVAGPFSLGTREAAFKYHPGAHLQ